MHLKTFLSLAFASVCSAALLSGCVGSKYVYSPQNRMLMASSHNDFLWLGPCGSPWNYDDQVNILFNGTGPRFDASQLEAYQNGKLKIDSGYVILDRTKKRVTIQLTFEGSEHEPVPCKYNGTHKFTLRDPGEGEETRPSLENLFTTNVPDFYQP